MCVSVCARREKIETEGGDVVSLFTRLPFDRSRFRVYLLHVARFVDAPAEPVGLDNRIRMQQSLSCVQIISLHARGGANCIDVAKFCHTQL